MVSRCIHFDTSIRIDGQMGGPERAVPLVALEDETTACLNC